MTSDARISDSAVPLDQGPLTEWDAPESWPVASSEDLHRDGWVVARRADRINRPGHEDEEAEMSIHWVPFEELLEAVLSGRATDSPVVQAVLAYAALKSRGRV